MKPTNNTPKSTKTIALPEIIVRLYENKESNTMAFVDLKFNDGFLVTGITVVWSDKKKAPFVSMPQRKGKDGEYHDTVFPITAEYRTLLYKAILEEYNNAVNEI